MWQLPKLSKDEILIYLRKSRSDDPLLTVEEVLANHEQLLEDWMAHNLPDAGGPIPEENRHREVVSGETIDSRPQMMQLLSRIESPKIKAVLCVEPQRLSRGDLEDIGRLVKLFRYSNTLILTRQYCYDLRDDHDRDSFERELKRGNDFLEYQKRIMANGRLAAVQRGEFIGRDAPYGYRKVVVGEGRHKCRTLEPVPDEANAVRLVFDLYLKGLGATAIANRLQSLAIKSPKGSDYWHRSTIRQILRNYHYAGFVSWQRYKQVKSIENGEVVVRRPMAEDFLIFKGIHPAIVTMTTWEAVQKKRGSIPKVRTNTEMANPLAGIIRCACGKSMVFKRYPHAEPRFFCSQQARCGNASCLADLVLNEVKKVLQDAIDDFEVRIKAGTDNTMEVHRQMVERMEKRIKELDALEVAQWEKYTLEGMPKHIFDTLNEKTLKEKADVQQALCIAKKAHPEPVDYKQKAVMFRELLNLMNDPEAPAREVNALARECIEWITYRRPPAPTRSKTDNWGTGNPVELDIILRV